MREYNKRPEVKERQKERRRIRRETDLAWVAREQARVNKRYLQPSYRAAAIARATAWRLAHPERYKENQRRAASHAPENNRGRVRQWRRVNPEKRRVQSVVCEAKRRAAKNKNGGDHTAAGNLIRKWRSNKVFVCAYCRHRFPIKALHVDHVQPLSKGGKHDPKNLAKSCGPCNIKKSDNFTA